MAAPAQLDPAKLDIATAKAREAMEAHANACYWCKFHPFALCHTGQAFLRAIPFARPALVNPDKSA